MLDHALAECHLPIPGQHYVAVAPHAQYRRRPDQPLSAHEHNFLLYQRSRAHPETQRDVAVGARDSRYGDAEVCMASLPRTTMSTRRFNARPSSVSLAATG